MDIGVYCMNMHHGIGLEAFLGRPFPPGLAISRETMAAIADLAEEIGMSSLWFGDHVIFPSHSSSSYPVVDKRHGTEIRSGEPVFDPLAIMANRLRAQITERRQELYIGQRLQPESSMAEAFLRQRQQRLGGGIAAV